MWCACRKPNKFKRTRRHHSNSATSNASAGEQSYDACQETCYNTNDNNADAWIQLQKEMGTLLSTHSITHHKHHNRTATKQHNRICKNFSQEFAGLRKRFGLQNSDKSINDDSTAVFNLTAVNTGYIDHDDGMIDNTHVDKPETNSVHADVSSETDSAIHSHYVKSNAQRFSGSTVDNTKRHEWIPNSVQPSVWHTTMIDASKHCTSKSTAHCTISSYDTNNCCVSSNGNINTGNKNAMLQHHRPSAIIMTNHANSNINVKGRNSFTSIHRLRQTSNSNTTCEQSHVHFMNDDVTAEKILCVELPCILYNSSEASQ